MDLRPSNASMDILVRAPQVITTMSESAAMIPILCHKLLIEDKMVNKLLYMRSVRIPAGDMNEVCRLIFAASNAANRGRI